MFHARPARKVRACRPRLEVLEDRTLPSTFLVDHLADDAVGSGLSGSLRYTMTNAADDDHITFGVTGTINLTGALPTLAHSISIEGPGPDQLTVRRDSGGDYRIFTVAADTTVSIIGLTVANGHVVSDDGGGIYNAGTLTISNCTISGNTAVIPDFISGGDGGGIYNGGTLTVSNSTLRGNSSQTTTDFTSTPAGGGAIYSTGTLTVTSSVLSGNTTMRPGRGGAIYNTSGTVTLAGTTLSGNAAGVGGGIANTPGGTVTITDCALSDNGAIDVGGGIYNFVAGTLTVTNSSLSGNSGDGGGIYNNGTVTITDSTLSGNAAPGGRTGGGIYNANPGTVTVTDSTLSDNTAFSGAGIGNNAGGTVTITGSTLSGNSAIGANAIAEGGGGAIGNGGTLTVTNSTFSGNSSGGLGGGGIYNNGTLTVTNSTFTGNSAFGGGFVGGAAGGGIRSGRSVFRNTIIAGNTAPAGPDFSGNLGSQGHNLIGDGAGGSGFDPTDLVGTSANPIDPMLGPLQNNGGPTQTMAPLLGSPAIAAGDPTGATDFDQRGAPRVVNGTIDIGAYEVQPAPVPRCSVAEPLLWPPNQQLINVGFMYQLNDDADPSTTVRVQVFANDQAVPADAADIGFGTLRLRAERQGGGQGRVYLIVVLATDASGQTGLDVCTVVVPHDPSARSVAAVQAAAADAEEFFRDVQTAPDGYALLGEGPAAQGAATAPSRAVRAGAGQQLGSLPQGDHPLMVGANQVDTPAGQTITPAVLVAVVNAFGNVETSDNSDTITLSIGANPGGGTLSGTLTVTVVNGVATFNDLSIDLAGAGYTLHATIGGGVPDLDSNPFNITT
jgi:hypothetical protein